MQKIIVVLVALFLGALFFVGLAAFTLKPVVAKPAPHPVVVPAPVVVEDIHFTYFGAEWCDPCRQMKKNTLADPKVQAALKAKFGMNVSIIDIDQMPAMAKAFNIDRIPTFLIIKDDKEVKRSVGYMYPWDFLEWLK